MGYPVDLCQSSRRSSDPLVPESRSGISAQTTVIRAGWRPWPKFGSVRHPPYISIGPGIDWARLSASTQTDMLSAPEAAGVYELTRGWNCSIGFRSIE